MDEDAERFLAMLDAATERVFEAYTGKMGAESCAVTVPQSEQLIQHSPSMQQSKEFSSQLSFRNTPPFQSESSSSFYEPQNRRKRFRTCEEPGFQSLVSNQFNFGLSDKNLLLDSNNHFVSWPQNFTFQSSGVNKSVGGLESKRSSFSVKNNHQLPKKLPSRIQRNLTNTGVSGVFDFDQRNVGIEKKEVEKPADISKEIEDAIDRIESLIPSLQKLVNSVHSPEQDSVADLGLPRISTSVPKEKDWVFTGNETGQMEISPAVGKVESDDQTSEETSWSTCASSSATPQQSGSSCSSSGTYESSRSGDYDSDEGEPWYETVARSTRRKQAQVETESSASAYDDSFNSYNSRDEYSDMGPSSSAQSHKWDLQKKKRGKRRVGRLRRLGKKLGMIFHHHHHHHHHHYNDKDEHDARHARSIWTRLGEMFHHTKNDADHHKETKAEKPRKSEVKTLATRKQQGGHFHALVDGLMKRVKHSKKPKQVKNGTKELGNACHGGKNLPWFPKLHKGRGGVKVSNKRKVKHGNYRTKSMAAAKIILGK